ncbi:MAG: LPS-assembly protein LptD, partial [Vicinamibacterales bacterium]
MCFHGWLRLCLAAALVLSARAASAQIVPGWNTKQFTLERIDADRVRLMREVEIEGEAGSPNAGQKIFADELELNTKTGELTARGSVVFATDTARISADSVVFNTETKRGTFHNASGIAQLGERGARSRSMFGTLEPDVYFYGSTIEKIGDDKYKITRGGFTTCVQPAPRWEIVSGSATVNLDDYVILRNAVIQVKHVPVFYLPVLYYPIQDDDRATGFLIPFWGTSTYRGQSISNAFFWAISRSQDATLVHDWYFSRGQGMGTEYRYLLAPSAQGNFRAYWLNEKSSVVNGVSSPERRSAEYKGGLSQGFPLGITGRVRVEYFTDVTVQQLYNNNFYDASRSTRTFGGGFSGAWKGLSLNSNYQRTEFFTSPTDSYVSGQAPGLSISYSGRRLGPLPIYASINAEGSNLLYIQKSALATQDLTLAKVDLSPSLRAPLSTLPYLQVNTTLSYRTTYFSESLDASNKQVRDPVSRSYADLRADIVGPVVSRVFSPNNALADRLKHVIEPSLSVQRTTSIASEGRIPTLVGGGYDTIVGGTTRYSYGFANRVLVRKTARADEPAASAPRELLNVSVRQSYYTDKRASQYDSSYSYGYLFRPASPFSPISLAARGAPIVPVVVDFRLEYDPTLEAARHPLVGFGLNGTARFEQIDATVGWSRRAFGGGTAAQSADYLQTSANLRLLENRIGGNVSFNYDIARSSLIQQRWTGYYNAQCCGISFEFQSFNFAGSGLGIPKDRRFNMSFTLAGIGSFSNFFGAFGG